MVSHKKITAPGCGIHLMAELWRQLMQELGYEKFYGWADCKGNVESAFTKDELLANVTLYLATETFHSSIRLYHESRKASLHFTKDDFVKVPVGIVRFPLEEPFPPRKYIERGCNIRHWTDMPAGGHFAAMEKPELLAEDIKDFFGNL